MIYDLESQEGIIWYHFESQECITWYHFELQECMNRYHFMYQDQWVHRLDDVRGDSLHGTHGAQDGGKNQKMVFIHKLSKSKLLKEIIFKVHFYFVILNF